MAVRFGKIPRLPQLAIADGATTPDPGGPAQAWSTTLSTVVFWTGSAWRPLAYSIAGTWTPTLTHVTNIAASTAYECQYVRVGNMVPFSGKVEIQCTAASNTASELGVSLPLASDFASDQQAGGTALRSASGSWGWAITADTTNNRLAFKCGAQGTASQTFYFSGMFRIV